MSSYTKKVEDYEQHPATEHNIPDNVRILPADSSYQMQPIHEEAQGDIICRCCHSSDNQEDMIVPCRCAGSVRFVHRHCLNTWRTVAPRPESFYQCDICNTNYVFQEQAQSKKGCLECKFGLLITLDMLTVLLVWQALVALCGLAVWGFSLAFGYNFMTAFPSNWPYWINYYICGHLTFLFVLGCIGIILGTVKIVQAIFGCGSRSESNSSSYTYDSYPYYSSQHLWWNWEFWLYWNLFYFNPWYSYHGGHYGGCDVCFAPVAIGDCVLSDCNHSGGGGSCDLKCDGGGDGAGSCAAILVGIVIIVAIVIIIIGVIVGVIFLVQIFGSIVKRRMSILKRRHEVKEAQVVDLRTLHGEHHV